jgi:hypothetical protein
LAGTKIERHSGTWGRGIEIASRDTGVTEGKVFRRVSKNGTQQDEGVTTDVVWYALERYAKQIGIDHLAPHDLHRTCARLYPEAGGELEQIQFLLGHASMQTTKRYIGCRQNLTEAVNDRFESHPQTCCTRSLGLSRDNPVYHVGDEAWPGGWKTLRNGNDLSSWMVWPRPRNEDAMNEEPALPKPWPMFFDETNGIWTITGDDARSPFLLATMSCHRDEHNGRRRHAAYLMANAEGMNHYIVPRADHGDNDARALVDAIQNAITASDAEESTIRSPSLNSR